MEAASRLSGGDAGFERNFFGCHGAIEPRAEEGKCECAGYNADRGCADIGRQSDAAQSRHDVDEPEREYRYQAEKEQIGKCVLTKSLHELSRQAAGATF